VALTARERRRQALTIRTSILISPEMDERIDALVQRQIRALGVDRVVAERIVSRSSVMRDALERGLDALGADR
jgi:Arc/MetJ-type ribon-helix-helix transcriptional regulator